MFSAQSPRGQVLQVVAVFHSGSIFPVERLVMSIASHAFPLGQTNPVDIVG